jgi:Rieske Fe-S protein
MVGRSLVVGALALVALLAAALLFGVSRSNTAEDPVVSLAELEDREVIYLEDEEIFVVYNDGEPLALSDDAQHVGDKVEFCLLSRMFEAPAHGEKFDIRGYYFGGPAERGLDRYPVRVSGDGVTIDDDEPITGPARGSVKPLEPEGDFCVPD